MSDEVAFSTEVALDCKGLYVQIFSISSHDGRLLGLLLPFGS